MSAGHKVAGQSGLGQNDLDRVLKDPTISKPLAEKLKIDNSWDLPYLAGYSEDGKTIFIDRHLPKILKIGRRFLWTVPPLVRHERLEKILEDVYGYKYPAAHQLATLFEERLVKNTIGTLDGYESTLKPCIKADEIEKLRRVPSNLDMTPYRSKPVNQELIKRMRFAMKHPEPAGKK